jgi:hypothetical protein
MDNNRLYVASSKLADYVRSPSLRHMRDPHNVQKLAREIVESLDRASFIGKNGTGLDSNLQRQQRRAGSP